jgi:hypothetical protein
MSTNFPNGVSSRGVPLPDGGRFSSPWSTHYFVDGISGSDGNTGKAPNNAFATIQAAVTAATVGDVIYLRPKVYVVGTGYARYTEDVTVALAKSNLSIIGIGSNFSNADYCGVRWKHATATNLTVNAPGLHLENIGFFSEGATYGILLQNNGTTDTQRGTDGFSLYHCALKGKGLYALSGGDGVSIDSSRFQCAYDGTVAQINYSCSANPGRRLTIRNCEFLDGNGTAPSAVIITIAPPMTEFIIRDCYFPQLPTGSVYIAIAGANEGLIANCYFNHDDLDTDAEITLGDAVAAVGCYDKAGIATTA